MTSPILQAYAIGETSCPLDNKQIVKYLKDDQLAWVHLDACHPDTARWLHTHINYLSPIIVNALLEEETRPRLLALGDGVLLILRGVNLNQDAEPEDMVSIRLWIDSHRIISIQRRPLKAVGDIAQRLEEKPDRATNCNGRGFCL